MLTFERTSHLEWTPSRCCPTPATLTMSLPRVYPAVVWTAGCRIGTCQTDAFVRTHSRCIAERNVQFVDPGQMVHRPHLDHRDAVNGQVAIEYTPLNRIRSWWRITATYLHRTSKRDPYRQRKRGGWCGFSTTSPRTLRTGPASNRSPCTGQSCSHARPTRARSGFARAGTTHTHTFSHRAYTCPGTGHSHNALAGRTGPSTTSAPCNRPPSKP